MAMVVKNNLSAMRTLNRLNKNSSALAKSLEKVSSGQKIVGAKDDSSAYAISEKMREQIRTLAQDNQNVQNGSSLFKVAAGGIDNIVEELRNLKELAINAANDTNTDEDRATIQKAFNQKMANINDIATTTNYNGKILLDGRYGKNPIADSVTSSSSSSESSTESTQINSPNRISRMAPRRAPAQTNTNIATNLTEPTGTITNISSGNYTITSDGVYSLDAGYTGTITVNAQNVKITQTNPTALENVSIVGPSGGNANLWIENLSITNMTDQNAIKFQGANNNLTIQGSNYLDNSIAGSSAAINTADGLTISGTGSLDVKAYNGASIGGDSGQTIGDITIIGDVTINARNVLNMAFGACIGGGEDGTNGNITIGGNANITATNYYAAAIGNGYSWNSTTSGNITIGGNAKVTAESGNAAAIGASFNGTVGDISIGGNATVVATSEAGAGIGGNDAGSTIGNITIGDDSTVTASSIYVAIGVNSNMFNNDSGNVVVGIDNLTNADTVTIQAGNSGTVNKSAERVSVGLYNIGTTGNSSTPTARASSDYTPLKIHHGTRANQATNFFLEDMHTKSLGTKNLVNDDGSFVNQSDKDRYEALGDNSVTPNQKQLDWLETLKSAQNKSLDDISVTTKQNANIAIRVLDGAIDYALDESTRVGAYLQRLDYTDQNITTMGENVQSAESTIRDADMAKEMTEYTKNNVLLQSAQAMLAQANQSSSQVLSLLQ